jgi:three-Cys-motif partner protein
MTAPRTKVWSIEPHTRAKHDLLSHYLKAWYPIIGRYSQRAVFIDAFAGPGVYEDGSPGSPIIALRTLLDHSAFATLRGCTFYFLFIESDKKRFAHLEAEITKMGALPANVQVMLRNSDFVTVADELASLIRDKKQGLAPTLAFLDPFGISGVPLNLIAQLLASDKCELFVTFMADHLNRFARTGQIDRHCEELFGTDAYRRVRGMSALIDLYEKQLRDVAKFTYVREFEMLRSDGHPAYYLIHATRSEKGVEKMKDAMWKVDPGSGFSFSDRHAGQGSLFVGDHVDTGPLRAALVANFAGKKASIEQLERFTLLETLYHPSSHLKRKTLALMEAEGLITVINPGPRRRRGDYPAGTEIRFAK